MSFGGAGMRVGVVKSNLSPNFQQERNKYSPQNFKLLL